MFIKVDNKFIIPKERFNLENINKRIEKYPASVQSKLSTVFRYLYLEEGPTNLPKETYKTVIDLLEPRERIIASWLRTRTNGRQRKKYGKNSLKSVRKAKYRCETCGFPDVRTLNLDHTNKTEKPFSCLCANCHSIKSRKEDWTGKKKYKANPGRPTL